jgi:hypothetical protein
MLSLSRGAEISQCCHVSRLRLSTILVVSPHDFPHLDSVSLITSTAPDDGPIHSEIRKQKNKNYSR